MPELPYPYPESKNDELTEAEKGVYIDEWLKIITRIVTNKENHEYAIKHAPSSSSESYNPSQQNGENISNPENTVVSADYNFVLRNELLVILKIRNETRTDHNMPTVTSQSNESYLPVIAIEIYAKNGGHKSVDVYYKGTNQIEYSHYVPENGTKKSLNANDAQEIGKILDDASFSVPATIEQVKNFQNNISK